MMNYEEAVKKVKAEKPKENFMLVKIDAQLVLPHSDGIALLNSLAHAEKMPDYYGSRKYITELDRHSLESSVISHQEYVRYKIAALLCLSLEEVKEAEEQAAKNNSTNKT